MVKFLFRRQNIRKMLGKWHFPILYTFVQLGKWVGKYPENEGKYGKWHFAYKSVTENARKMTRKMKENKENRIFEACETRKMMGYVYKTYPFSEVSALENGNEVET